MKANTKIKAVATKNLYFCKFFFCKSRFNQANLKAHSSALVMFGAAGKRFPVGMGETVLLRESVLSVPVTTTNRSFDSFSRHGLLRNLAKNLISHWQRDRYRLSLAETLR